MLHIILTLCCCFFADDVKIPAKATIAGHSSSVIGVAFSPDGKRLASVADDGSLKVWDIATQKEIAGANRMHNNRNPICFSHDGAIVYALASGAQMLGIEAGTGKVKQAIEIADLPGGAAWFDISPDGKLAAVSGRSALRIYDLAAGKLAYSYEVHKLYAVPAVAFSPDGKLVATAGTDGKALIIDYTTGKVVNAFDCKYKGQALAFSPDAKRLFLYSDDRVITAFDLATGEGKKIFDGGMEVSTMCISPGGKRLIAAGISRTGPGVIKLPGASIERLPFEVDDITKCAAISSDGHWIAAGSNEGKLRVWAMPE